MDEASFHAQALAELDIRIAEHEKILQALKEERNSHLRAIRLPPEVLTRIFVLAAQQLFESYKPPQCQLWISHVCRYWREVVLCSQEFWRYQPLDRDGALWPDEAIERAKEKPPHLRIDLGRGYRDYWDGEILECIEPMVTQAASMSIRILDPFLSEACLDLLPSCPNLERVAILGEANTHFSFRVPEELFGQDLCHLHQLSLRDVDWTWSASYFVPSLTSLSLRGTLRLDEECRVALRHLPSLQYLELDDTAPPSTHSSAIDGIALPDSPKSVKLPHLQELRLCGDPYPTSLLINSFDFPLSTKVVLRCTHLNEKVDEPNSPECPHFDCLLTWISQYFQRLEEAKVPVRALQVREPTNFAGYVIRLRFWTNAQIPDWLPEPLSRSPPQLELDFTQFYKDEGPLHYFQKNLWRITSHLPLSAIEYLHLDNIPVMKHADEVFEALTRVRILHVSGCQRRAPALLKLVTPRPKVNNEETKDIDSEEIDLQNPLLPLVHTLILQNTRLPEPKFGLNFVKRRARLGCAIQTFRVWDCKNVYPSWLEELRKQVDVVEWDEKEGPDLSDSPWLLETVMMSS